MGSSNDDSKQAGPDASISSRQSSVSLDEPFGLLPSYTERQREAMASHFRGDMATANRYTSLKEWAIARGTKFFQSGNIRLGIKADIATAIYHAAEAGESVSAGTVDEIRDIVRSALCDTRVDEFKRRLCLEIIKTRNPEYSVYQQNASTEGDSSVISAVDPLMVGVKMTVFLPDFMRT